MNVPVSSEPGHTSASAATMSCSGSTSASSVFVAVEDELLPSLCDRDSDNGPVYGSTRHVQAEAEPEKSPFLSSRARIQRRSPMMLKDVRFRTKFTNADAAVLCDLGH